MADIDMKSPEFKEAYERHYQLRRAQNHNSTNAHYLAESDAERELREKAERATELFAMLASAGATPVDLSDLNRESYREPTREEAVAAADRMHAELTALRADHAALVEAVRALVDAARQVDVDVEAQSDLHPDLRTALYALNRARHRTQGTLAALSAEALAKRVSGG